MRVKKSFVICILFFACNVNALSFFRSRGYDIPPPVGIERRDASIPTKYFPQKVDHYDPTNEDVWLQRYFVNTQYFNTTTKNVAFIMIGGEGQASISWMTSGAWIVTAKKYGAVLFELEHRFYGKSHPFSDMSLDNLRYLSSQQALSDIANFIVAMNEEYRLSSDVKWIAFGGSYPGALAAWLRVKYPHIVQGAMSSSGPLFAKLEFPEYMQVVADDLAAYGQDCVNAVEAAISQVERLLRNPGKENVTSIFSLCHNIEEDKENVLDISNFFHTVLETFASIAQSNKNYGRTVSIDDLCDILTSDSLGKEMYRLAYISQLTHTGCLDYKYGKYVRDLQNTTIVESENGRQWIYQTCTEYGWYQTTDQEIQVFGHGMPLDYYTKLCSDVFGEKFNEHFITKQTTRTNVDYGGFDIDVSNVVFVHGSFDPWHPLGLLETRNPNAPVIFINGTAHCANLYDASKDDLPALTAAREEIDRLIGVWLGVITSEYEEKFEQEDNDLPGAGWSVLLTGNEHLYLSLMSYIICVALAN